MEQERINANVNSLSQKLLEGCKLLSDSCPETNVPLVSTPNGRMFSVGNGSYYVREAGELVKIPGAAESLPSAAVAAAPATPKSPPRGGFLGFAPGAPQASVEVPSAVPDGQSLSSRVAAKLLEGFTLLSESCPVTSVPLVQDASGRILSVGTGRWYERTGGEIVEAAAPPTPSLAQAAAEGAIAVVPPSATAVAPPSLPAAPPKPTGTPLPLPAVGSSSAAAAAPPSVYMATPGGSPPKSSLPGTPFGAGAAGAAYGTGASAAVASAVLSQAGMLPPPPSAAATALPPSAAAHGLRLSVANGGAASLKLGAQEGVAVLTSRLAEATAALADCPIREAPPYVAMIKDIGLAIAALKALQ